MATSSVAVTEGSGKNLATNSISEDAITKQLSRVVVNTSAGVETTFPAVGSAAAASTDVISVQAALAHDAVSTENPINTGGVARTGLAAATMVSSLDKTNSHHGVDGIQFVRPHSPLEDIVSGVAAITDGSSTSVIASAGAGVKNYITTAIVANTSATVVTVDLRDGAAGTVKATLPVPANNSGVVCNFPVPLPFSAATAVCADPSTSASTITVTLIGFKSKV